MARWRVVATDSLRGWDWSHERAVLAQGGAALEVRRCSTQHEVGEVIRSADVVLNHLTVGISAEALPMGRRCRAIVACGTGHDHIDVDAATARGMAVATLAGYCTDEVSDHALALLLSLSRRLFEMARHVRAGEWDARSVHPVRRVQGRVLGLIGFGKIARRLTPKAHALGLRVVAFDPFVPPEEMTSLGVSVADDLGELLQESDYVSLHAPLTPETHRVLDARALGQMKQGACLINCSRGELIDEDALHDALADGRLGGVGLDVLANEPMSDEHPLRAFDNVVITPHAAWLSVEAEEELHRGSAATALAVLRGELPRNTVNAAGARSFWWLER